MQEIVPGLQVCSSAVLPFVIMQHFLFGEEPHYIVSLWAEATSAKLIADPVLWPCYF